MRAAIVTTPIGVFVVDDKNEIAGYVKFPRSAKEIAEKMEAAKISIIREERVAMDSARAKGLDEFSFPAKKPGVKYVDKNKEQFVKENLRRLAIEYNFVGSQVELNRILTDVNIALTKAEIKESIKRDSLVVQVNGVLEELDKSINIFIERLREWYGVHFPEMDREVPNHEKFVSIVEKFGNRNKIIDEEALKSLAGKSMGMEITDRDAKELQDFAHIVHELYKLRGNLEKYLDDTLAEVAPNVNDLAGPILAAKLMSKAGGLGKLARMPSSTIQLLGAEKALFRHLHGKGKSPKHGIISIHPLVQNAPAGLRGKCARLLASKISVAARVDNYSEKPKLGNFKKDLEKKVNEVLKPSRQQPGRQRVPTK